MCNCTYDRITYMMYVCTETWARALLVWVSAGREGTSRMPCIGKREMRKSSPLFTRHPFSCVTQFNALITLCTQVPVLTPTFPIYSFGSRILWCIPHPQLVQDFSFQTTNHVSHPSPNSPIILLLSSSRRGLQRFYDKRVCVGSWIFAASHSRGSSASN